MNKLIFIVLFFSNFWATAQSDLEKFYNQQQKINKTGLKVLTGWAMGNILLGTASYFIVKDPYLHGFCAMNAGWNVINLGLGLGGLLSKPYTFDGKISKVLKEQSKLEKIYLFNAGLDFGYMAGGFWMHQYGISTNNNFWIGAGDAIVIQGAFLAVFDGFMFYKHQKKSKDLIKGIENMELNLKSNGIELKF